MLSQKSTRVSWADKENEVEVASNNNKEKRKRSKSEEDLGSSSRRPMKKTKDGRVVDKFCWKCHKLEFDKICSTCPKVYHDNCLKAGKFTGQDVCPDCLLPSVDGTMPSAGLTTEMMDKVLVCLIRRLLPATTSKSFGFESHSKGRFSKMNDKIPTNFPELMKWPERKYKTCKPVDLGMLIEAIKSGGFYSSTIEFFSDVQWMYHNSYKCFGAQSDITKAANKIVKAVKNEILDIEACYECYYRNYNEIELYDSDPFPLICKNPHTLVWAKLKGYPFWPSKCLKVIDGKAQIQFFGTHDKNSVEATACYLLSRENPNPKFVGQKSYKSAIVDLQFYIQNYCRKIGPYNYAEDKVPFLPSDNWHWVKEKPQALKRKAARKSMHVRKAIRLENENEDTGHNTGDDSGPYIVMSSVREISNEDAFQGNCEPQTAGISDPSASVYNYQNATNSWTTYPSQLHLVSNSSSNFPYLVVAVRRLDDSVIFQYQQNQFNEANSQINVPISHPVIANVQYCDESTQSIHETVTVIEQPSQGPSAPFISCGGVETLSHSENILGSSTNDHEDSANESPTARSSSGEDLNQVISFMGLNKNSLTDPEMLKLIKDGGRFVSDSGLMMLQYSNVYHMGLGVISSIIQKVISLDSAFKEIQREKAEIWRRSIETFNPIITQIIKGTKKKSEEKLEEVIEREKRKLNAETKNFLNVLSFCNKEHSNYNRRIYPNRQNKGTQYACMTEEEYAKRYREITLEKQNLEKEYSAKLMEIRSQVWCIQCQNLGKIYCCWNTHYCTEACRIKHLSIHKPSCRRKKPFRNQTAVIEDVTASEAYDDQTSDSIVPIVELT